METLTSVCDGGNYTLDWFLNTVECFKIFALIQYNRHREVYFLGAVGGEVYSFFALICKAPSSGDVD